jgi:C-terminal processing protease CtpA/Prc
VGALVLAQVSPQPARQRGNNTPQNQNQVAPAADQPANQTNPATRAADNSRQAARTDQADSRPRQGGQSEEQDAAWLGVFLSERDSDRSATVAHVYPAGPAARAGLQSGDVIQQINGQQVNSGQDLVSTLEQMHPGDKAELTVLRSNEPTKLTAKLGSRNSYTSHNRPMDRYFGRGGQGQGGQYDENDDMFNFPLHAMELEHNRRNAEQHQRIENEIAQLRDEIRQLRESLQKR